MTEKNEVNAIALIDSKAPYEEALWEKLFEVWLFLADRNCTRARKLFLETFRISENINDDSVPTVRQIQYKAKQQNWDRKGNETLRAAAKHIDDNHLARLLVSRGKALDLLDRIVSGDYYDGKAMTLSIMEDAAKELLKLGGLGTAGMLTGIPTLKVEVKASDADTAKLSFDERAQRQRNMILASKQTKKLTGRK